MKIYYDTEFHEQGGQDAIRLISIGMVAEDGRELYAVNAGMDQDAIRTHPWLSRNVWPHLPLVEPRPGTRGGTHRRLDMDHPDVRPQAQIARMILDFVRATPSPQLWAYYAAYDHVVLAQLWGRMVDLPNDIPMHTNCLRQEAVRLGDPPLPVQAQGEHHALADARHARDIDLALSSIANT